MAETKKGERTESDPSYQQFENRGQLEKNQKQTKLFLHEIRSTTINVFKTVDRKKKKDKKDEQQKAATVKKY